ncbi:MAG: RNA 2'-phosphotransferase [Gemmataceae bacterium]
MNPKRLVHVSKFLSRHLRHAPADIGLSLRPGGWVAVNDLLAGCQRAGLPLTRGDLEEVVATNDKQRFAFDDTGEKIRANQGHSVEVDLQLQPTTPPDVLYHGTSTNTVGEILKTGLKRMRRHHVHLSAAVPTAEKVGSRHGRPAVLVVDAAAMRRDGLEFYRSANGVWLVEEVPPTYLRLLGE